MKMKVNEILLDTLLVDSVGAWGDSAGSRRRQWVECRGGGESEQQQFDGTRKLLLREAAGAPAKLAANDVGGRKYYVDENRFRDGDSQSVAFNDFSARTDQSNRLRRVIDGFSLSSDRCDRRKFNHS